MSYQNQYRSELLTHLYPSQALPGSLPLPFGPTYAELDSLPATAGLTLMQRCMEQEIAARCGAWGSQTHHRHGTQPGYVVFHGRKVAVRRPRLRCKQGGEAILESYRAFQQDGLMQRSVARQLIQEISTRQYAAALDVILDGYGIQRSSVSRHWRTATARELERVCQRPIPPGLLALFLSVQRFRGQPLLAALGVDWLGQRHLLGLWEAVAHETMLDELIRRGLQTDAPLLLVIDDALKDAVRARLGSRILIHCCRVHKLRQLLTHLPLDRHREFIRRWRRAWAQGSVSAIHAALFDLATELPSVPAALLTVSLTELLTVHRLGLPRNLRRSLSSTRGLARALARSAHWTRRVKRWRDPRMLLRWAAAAVLASPPRRLNGFVHLPALRAALTRAV